MIPMLPWGTSNSFRSFFFFGSLSPLNPAIKAPRTIAVELGVAVSNHDLSATENGNLPVLHRAHFHACNTLLKLLLEVGILTKPPCQQDGFHMAGTSNLVSYEIQNLIDNGVENLLTEIFPQNHKPFVGGYAML
jgi:hypothetical protein